jgi:hypothetical protein
VPPKDSRRPAGENSKEAKPIGDTFLPAKAPKEKEV